MAQALHPSFPRFDFSVLTDQQREVVEMHYDCCLSFREIARFLCVSKRTVQTHHERALSKLLDTPCRTAKTLR